LHWLWTLINILMSCMWYHRGPPPAGVSVAEWQHELELEDARQLSLALEASRRECCGLPSEDLIQVLSCPPLWFLAGEQLCTVSEGCRV
jgi:hypothetical protein